MASQSSAGHKRSVRDRRLFWWLGFLTEPVVAYIHHAQREGHRASIAWVGREEPPQVTGIRVVDAREVFRVEEDVEDLFMSVVDEQFEMNARMNQPVREYDRV